MNRKPLLLLLGVLGLVLLLGGLIYWRRTASAPTADATATTAAASAAPVSATLGSSVHDNGFGEQVPVTLTEDKTALARLYQVDYVKEYYESPDIDANSESGNRAPLPPFDYNQSLAGKSYLDLLLLRNEIYARNGYCFMSAPVRQHFAKRKWYRPIWSYTDSVIRVPLNRQEVAFAQRVRAEEVKLLARRVQPQSGHPMIGMDFVTNQRQMLVTPAMRTVLTRNNFVLVPTREEQLFYLYDQNQYDYTPNFITTDLVLQLLHKYLNGILSDVEEKRLVPVVSTMLQQGAGQAQLLAQQSQNPQARDAAEWAAAYYAVGHGLLTGARPALSGPYAELAAQEVALCTAAADKGSALLQDSLFDYSACKPRGMYTLNDTTRRYFRAVKWLNSAPVFLDSDAGLLRAVALAKAVEASPQGKRNFESFTQVLDVLVGDEDNRSVTHLLRLLRARYAGQSLDALTAPATLTALRRELVAAGTDRIRAKGATAKAEEAVERPKLLFTAGRYTFDGEILSRLTNVLRPKPQQEPPRPFPKGLDVFAAFGNQTAQNILLKEYREADRWPAYPDTLRAVQRQFGQYRQWDQNLYTKTMQMLIGMTAPAPANQAPLFARTPAWQKRNLSTALGGWTELKHDLLLYTEQPMGAEAGDGGDGPPRPRHLSYVEPNLPFWDGALALLQLQDRALTRLNANTEHLAGINKDLQKLVTSLRNVARKELNGQPLTDEEMNTLSWIGGEVEQMTIRILKTDIMPDRERHIGLVADVYAFNEDVLEEAVGAADALYVVVDINGAPVLARGAAFSYYEFTSPTRLTDEEWRAKLARQEPARPVWLRELIVPVKQLATHSGSTL